MMVPLCTICVSDTWALVVGMIIGRSRAIVNRDRLFAKLIEAVHRGLAIYRLGSQYIAESIT